MDFREIKEFFRDFSIYLITFAVIAIILVFIVSPHPIAGNSMVPTLEEGDIALVSKFSYYFSNVKRGNIVIVKVNGKNYVKRVIGLPGENIKILKNILYINDEPFTEEYLANGTSTSGFTLEDICKEECINEIIPENKYLVLGDNRPESEDSRSFGLVDKGNIKGKIFFRIWPLKKIGSVR